MRKLCGNYGFLESWKVENLKLYEPPMIMDKDESVQILKVGDFSLEYLNELQENDILDKRLKTS